MGDGGWGMGDGGGGGGLLRLDKYYYAPGSRGGGIELRGRC